MMRIGWMRGMRLADWRPVPSEGLKVNKYGLGRKVLAQNEREWEIHG
jgi:hypothetical protein